MRLVPRLEGDRRDRHLALLQPQRSPLEAQPPDVALHRFAHHTAEDAVEVKGGEEGDPGQTLERKVVVEVLLDVNEHP